MKPHELAEAARQIEKGVMLTPRMGRRMLAYIRQLKAERDLAIDEVMRIHRALKQVAAEAGAPLEEG